MPAAALGGSSLFCGPSGILGSMTRKLALRGCLLSLVLLFGYVAVPAGADTLPARVSFRHDVEAVLSKAGCNAGTCHGSPTGKNGFRLSLRGYNPEFDYLSLTRHMLGRRVDRNRPDGSLVLLKALGRMPHGGGRRIGESGRLHAILRDWIAAGAPDDPPRLPALTKIEMLPRERDLRRDNDRQQVTVRAYFADGLARDV